MEFKVNGQRLKHYLGEELPQVEKIQFIEYWLNGDLTNPWRCSLVEQASLNLTLLGKQPKLCEDPFYLFWLISFIFGLFFWDPRHV